jgi:hypothetical protein
VITSQKFYPLAQGELSMAQVFTSSPTEIKAARWPHEILLINLVFNHVFVFVVSLGVIKSIPWMIVLTPIISFCIISYILTKQKRLEASDASFFLKGHWKIAATRNRWFLYLLIFTCTIAGGGYFLFSALGLSKITLWALVIGVGLLPFMIVLLTLVTLSSDSMNVARDGRLPDSFLKNNPPPATE